MKRKHNPKQISTVLSVIMCLFATLTQTAHAKNISPQRAAQIAKKYITLPHDNALKAPANTSTSPLGFCLSPSTSHHLSLIHI